jgi:hypothetical protein
LPFKFLQLILEDCNLKNTLCLLLLPYVQHDCTKQL